MYATPKGWTNHGQKRGCLTLQPKSTQAKLVNLEEENRALRNAMSQFEERLGALETTGHETKKKKV